MEERRNILLKSTWPQDSVIPLPPIPTVPVLTTNIFFVSTGKLRPPLLSFLPSLMGSSCCRNQDAPVLEVTALVLPGRVIEAEEAPVDQA
jgi:hypothetical protein